MRPQSRHGTTMPGSPEARAITRNWLGGENDRMTAEIDAFAAQARTAAIEEAMKAIKAVPSNENAIREGVRWECWSAVSALARPTEDQP